MLVNILLADQCVMVTDGLQLLLRSQFRYSNTRVVTSCAKLMSALKREQTSHLIFDLNLQDESITSLLPTISLLYPFLNLMAYTELSLTKYRKVFRVSNVPYQLSKTTPKMETIAYMGKFLAADQSIRTKWSCEHDDIIDKLTPTEAVVLGHLLEGRGTNEIAKLMHVKQNSISTLKRRIFEKCEVKNSISLLGVIKQVC